jgi:cyclic beta-1,2-glucan synthetase
VAEHGQNNRAVRLLEMLAPISHALTTAAADRYKVEPYVVAADIYGAAPHIGRGGWTWYTGSSGWMYRVAVESILGLRMEGGDALMLDPCVPDSWPSFRVTWKKPGGKAAYEITVNNPSLRAGHVIGAEVDGQPVLVSGGTARIPLSHDCGHHSIRVTMG